VADPVTPGDLAATIFWRFGIDPATEISDRAGRTAWRWASRSACCSAGRWVAGWGRCGLPILGRGATDSSI
jgi:hypothetical protein